MRTEERGEIGSLLMFCAVGLQMAGISSWQMSLATSTLKLREGAANAAISNTTWIASSLIAFSGVPLTLLWGLAAGSYEAGSTTFVLILLIQLAEGVKTRYIVPAQARNEAATIAASRLLGSVTFVVFIYLHTRYSTLTANFAGCYFLLSQLSSAAFLRFLLPNAVEISPIRRTLCNNWQEIRRLVGGAKHSYFAALALYVTSSFDKIAFAVIPNKHEAGLFFAAASLVSPPAILLSQTAFTLLNSPAIQGRITSRYNLFVALLLAVFVVASYTVPLYVFRGDIIRLVLGTQYFGSEEYIAPLAILSIGYAISPISQAMAMSEPNRRTGRYILLVGLMMLICGSPVAYSFGAGPGLIWFISTLTLVCAVAAIFEGARSSKGAET